MPADYEVKTIAPTRLIAITATIDPATVSERIGPMFDTVADALHDVPGALDVPIATYAESDAGMDVVVGFSGATAAPPGTTVVDLPEAHAVCGTHLGPMTGIRASWEALHRWASDNGYTFAGPCREVYVRAASSDQTDWVTELQQPVASVG